MIHFSTQQHKSSIKLPKKHRQPLAAAVHKAIGTTEEGQPFFLPPEDRNQHTHIIGTSGSGKSKFLELLVRGDLQNKQCGACVIDPHGSLYDAVLEYAAVHHPDLAQRFILFNPAQETEHIIGFNPIPQNGFENIDYCLETLIGACLKVWGQDNLDRTPRITTWLENIFYTLIINDLTLVESQPLIDTNNNKNRDRLLSRVQNDLIRSHWVTFEKSSQTQRQTLMEGATNRLRKFLRNETIRAVIGQQKNRLDLLKIMNEGKILLVNLSGKDKISQENMRLLGILLVTEFYRIAKLRDPANAKKKPFHLYIDEFANFITNDIARALEETRKFGLFLILAHQHLEQLSKEDEYLYAAVNGICKNKIAFGGLSAEDAKLMSDAMLLVRDLKQVKHEQYSTKIRHVEEQRVVPNIAFNHSESTQSSHSKGENWQHSTSQSKTEAKAIAEGQQDIQSTTLSSSETEQTSIGKSISNNKSQSTSQSIAKSTGESESIALTEGHGHSTATTTGQAVAKSKVMTNSKQRSSSHSQMHGQNHATTMTNGYMNGGSHSEGTSTSQTRGHSDSTTNNWNDTQTSSNTKSSTNTQSQSHGVSNGRGRSHSHTDSASETNGSNSSDSQNWSQSQSQAATNGHSIANTEATVEGTGSSVAHGLTETTSESATVTDSTNHSLTKSKSHSQQRTVTDAQTNTTGQSETQSNSRSTGKTKGKATTVGQSTSKQITKTQATATNKTEGVGGSQVDTTGTTSSKGMTTGYSIVPFQRPVEYPELSSITWWSLAELKEMQMLKLREQPTGYAFIKIGTQAAKQVAISHVAATKASNLQMKVKHFRQKVFRLNAQYYLSAENSKLEYQQRQLQVFEEVLNYDDKGLEMKQTMPEEPAMNADPFN